MVNACHVPFLSPPLIVKNRETHDDPFDHMSNKKMISLIKLTNGFSSNGRFD
jgi:hypothetical protein